MLQSLIDKNIDVVAYLTNGLKKEKFENTKGVIRSRKS
jgi:hypothetical protein